MELGVDLGQRPQRRPCLTPPLLAHAVTAPLFALLPPRCLNFLSRWSSLRSERRAGLLHPAERHAPAAPAGGARGGDPGGPEDGGQAGERLHPGVRAEGQADGAGGEADPRGG